MNDISLSQRALDLSYTTPRREKIQLYHIVIRLAERKKIQNLHLQTLSMSKAGKPKGIN